MKDKKNPIGLDDFEEPGNIVDELIRIHEDEPPEVKEAFYKSDLFKMATQYDPRYHPELAPGYKNEFKN